MVLNALLALSFPSSLSPGFRPTESIQADLFPMGWIRHTFVGVCHSTSCSVAICLIRDTHLKIKFVLGVPEYPNTFDLWMELEFIPARRLHYRR
jgi:hypothetical protein